MYPDKTLQNGFWN